MAAKKIAWLYHRKNCTGCERAHAWFKKNKVEVAGPAIDARQVRFGADEAVALAKDKATTVVSGRGAKVTVVNLKKDPPADEDLAKMLLGPSGNLKAPTVLVGKTLIVGCNEAAYEEYLA
jgi:arsenate reductase-like glutaredoxin family protein